MVQAFTSCCFLFLLLLVATFTGAREIKTEIENTDGDHRISSGAGDVENEEAANKEMHDHGHGHEHVQLAHAHPSSSAMINNHHLDPSLFVFFLPEDLKAGKAMSLYFPKRNPSTSPKILSRREADSIPFSSKQIPYLLEFFSFSQGSPQAKAIEYTLGQCESNGIKGETKFCATSLETLLDSTRTILGSDANNVRVLTTKHLIKSNTTFQNYTIVDVPKKVPAPKTVACHTMPYPYAVYYCHSHKHGNRVFEVSLAGENGDLIRALAVCHMDTSHWGRDHVSFRVLGVEPGERNELPFIVPQRAEYIKVYRVIMIPNYGDILDFIQ